MRNSSKILRQEITLLVAVVLFFALLSFTSYFRLQRDKLIDLLFTAKPHTNQVVLLKIDEGGLQAIGQWPWPRAIFANLVQKLSGASAIGIDVNFKEASRLGEQDDLALEQAIRNSKIHVVLTNEVTSFGPVTIAKSKFSEALSGYANMIVSPDGVVRKFWPQIPGGESFSLALAKSLDRYPVGLLDKEIRIHYLGPINTVSAFSVKDFLQNKIPKEFFENKIVLVGVTAKDLQDFHHTPFGLMSGVELQANVLETVISQNFLFDLQPLWLFLIILILGGLTLTVGFKVKKLFPLLGWIILILVLYNLIAFWGFDHGMVFDLFYPNLVVIVTAILSVVVQYISTSREKRFIQESFGKYLAPEVIKELINDPTNLKLGGQRRELSILFSDIRDFTSMAEKMSPEQLTEFMGDYLTRMTNIVLDHRGVVDKYIGDAVMAFWGAPVPEKDHAGQAVSAALAMIKELEKFNKENRKRGWPEIKIGVGINSGEVVVGNMGSEKRFDYTVIGDNVNIASRLEGLNKTYQTKILISEATAKQVADRLELKDLGLVQVKGRQGAIRIFEVLKTK